MKRSKLVLLTPIYLSLAACGQNPNCDPQNWDEKCNQTPAFRSGGSGGVAPIIIPSTTPSTPSVPMAPRSTFQPSKPVTPTITPTSTPKVTPPTVRLSTAPGGKASGGGFGGTGRSMGVSSGG